MNFEGFVDLLHRVVGEWYLTAKKEIDDIDAIKAYLENSPFSAKQTPENERAYEKLMDLRMKMFDLSYEIDRNHDCYMEFMQQCLDKPDLMEKAVKPLELEEKHLVHLELMIMEQVADWELDSGKNEYGSQWSKAKQLVVDLPNGSTKTISISQEAERRYWFGICAVTSKIGNMKLCAGCKVIGYIGKEEQKEDWSKHKELCKLLQKARGSEDHWSLNLDPEKMRSYLESGLGRALQQFESDLITHPRLCGLCNSGEQQSEMKNCKQCFCVAFHPEHAEEGMKYHEEHCSALKTAAEDYKNEITLGHQVQTYNPTIIKGAHQPLPEDIEAFFSGDIADLVSKKLPGYQETELRYLTFLYTCPLTVMYGMESCQLASGEPVSSATSLTFHLVGTRIAEMRHLTGWEVIACRLPKLKKLNLIFIGDETPAKDFPKEFSYKGTDLQNNRKALEVKYFFEPPQLYQNYSKTVPDAIIALDCGFKFYPSWRAGIEKMLQNRSCPIIFTEFTLEDQKDNLNMIQKLGAIEVSMEPRRNPYCSRRPVRCTDKSGNYKAHSVIYTNDFICVVKPA